MDYFKVSAPKKLLSQIEEILVFYDYKFDLEESSDDKITKHLKTGDQVFGSVEEFLLKGLFYSKKKNLHYFPVINQSNTVANFDIDPLEIITSNPIITVLMKISIFKELWRKVYNYGTFIRLSENKVQRLYWSPALNAGIPLTAKEKDPVYELIFLLHDYGHFLLPDLIFTGNKADEKAKRIYVNWRLLGESITIVLNEMLAVHYLKDTPEFKANLKIGYDKPFSLYQILNKHDLKQLFWASYLYFSKQDHSGFEELLSLDCEGKIKTWHEFNTRYIPVSERGREWTETNFDRLKEMSNDYIKWWKVVEEFKSELQLSTVDDYYEKISDMDNLKIMEYLFEHVWVNVLEPVLTSTDDKNTFITKEMRKVLAFKRYMIGNIFLLIKFDVKHNDILEKMRNMTSSDIPIIKSMYETQVKELYAKGLINMNEYHNYKNIFIMIPPNILKKDVYAK